jgi:hypothetical protein
MIMSSANKVTYIFLPKIWLPPSSVDLRLQLLHPFDMDSYQGLTRELLGLQSWTRAAVDPVVLRLPDSWTEQLPGSLPL